MVEYLYLKPALVDKTDHFTEHFIGLAAAVADIADTKGGNLPQIVVINLGDGNVEFVAHPGGNRFQYPSLTLEGEILRETKL